MRSLLAGPPTFGDWLARLAVLAVLGLLAVGGIAAGVLVAVRWCQLVCWLAGG